MRKYPGLGKSGRQRKSKLDVISESRQGLGLSVEALVAIEEALEDRGQGGGLTDPGVRAKSDKSNGERLKRWRQEQKRKRRDAVIAKRSADRLAKGQGTAELWKARPAGHLPQYFQAIATCPDVFTIEDVGTESARCAWNVLGWYETLGRERVEGTYNSPSWGTYRLTAEGEAARDFAMWCWARAVLGMRSPVLGNMGRLIGHAMRGEDLGPRDIAGSRGRKYVPGDWDDAPWPDFERHRARLGELGGRE